MGKKICLIYFLCLLPVGLYALCTGDRKEKFPMLPDSYQTVIEINADIEHYSILQREYRDGKGKRMMISQLQKNKKTRVIIDETNKQTFHIKDSDGTCTVTNSSVINPDNKPFGGINKANGKFLYSTETAMGQMKDKAVNAGLVQIRGIKVRHWCADISDNLQSHMYFTVSTWKTAGGFSQKPVRFILQEITNSSSTVKYNYEYYTFFPRIRDNPTSIFEPPSGVICKGRKGSKKIPKLPTYFSYRQETVYDDYVKVSDVWYDEKNRLLRIDYRPGGIGRAMSSAMSEIHDYNTGVLYTKNLYFGNCSISTISNSSFGTEQNATSWKKDKSYEVMLKNPLQYFYLDSNYIYVGKKVTRQVQCDVFASTRNSFVMPNGRSYPVVLEFYFASDDYEVLPDKANNITVQVPMMLLVSTQDKSLDLTLRINIVDFNVEHHDLTLFDVSSCYSSTAKMHISILIDGQYVEATKEEIIGEGRAMIASLMKISPNRVQNVHMSHDTAVIALYASILDRSPAAAQFSHVSSKKQKISGDAIFKGVKKMSDCANNCVQSTKFVCNSFDICGNDCILSRTHIPTKATDGGSVTCDHYSRTVDGPQIKEINLSSAWYNLRKNIAKGIFLMEIPNDTGDSVFKAIFARLDYGIIMELADVPKLSNNLKYKEEIVSPSEKDIQPVSVYYDALKNLTRFDSWINQGCLTCSRPVETIQDFHLGVQYIVDKVTGECHSGHIIQGTFDVINEDPSQKKLTKMKDAWALFYLDESYYFVGQKEIRGIMTDIFEAWRTDFTESNDALFRYHFLSQNWKSVNSLVPVKLEIVADMDIYSSVYNLFEFIEEPIPMSTFDVTECFRESNQIIDFQITFQGSYKLQPANFILAVINQIKKSLQLSGIRIQEPEISYDDHNTYFQASLLEPPPSISMFNEISGMSTVSKPDQIVKNVPTQEACADQCVKIKNINCNAFSYCQVSKRCELHTKHFGDSHMQPSETCSFYTRTEDAPLDLLSAKDIMIDLIDLSRKGMLKIAFDIGEMTYRFTAKSVLMNIDRNNSRDIASVQNMESYNKSVQGAYLKKYNTVIMKVSVDECAYRCTQSLTFDCQAFSYCYLLGECVLSEDHPTNATIASTTWCDIYERNYLNLFEQLPGQTFPMQGWRQMTDVTSPDTCARECFNSGVGDCQSFEYCESLKACSFSKRHTMDVPSSDIISSVKCSVYSLTFLKDFKKASTKVENLVDNVLIKNVSVKQCAHICLRDQGPDCASFDYCPSDNICRITGVDEFGTGEVSGPTSLNCSHYTRIDRKIFPKPFRMKYIKGNKGVATGLGIGMFMLGSVLGILMIYIIHKRGTSWTDDHTKVSFLKMEDQ